MFEEGYVSDLVCRIKNEWGESVNVHSILSPSEVAPKHRSELADELQHRLQALFPDDFVTAREYGVGDIKISKKSR